MTIDDRSSPSSDLARRRSRQPEFRRAALGYRRGQVDGLVSELIGSVDEFRDRARSAEDNERNTRFELAEVSRALEQAQLESERARRLPEPWNPGRADGAELIEAVQRLASHYAADTPRRALDAAQAGWAEVLATLEESTEVSLTPEGAAIFSTIIASTAREAAQVTAESGAAVADLVRQWVGAPGARVGDPPGSSAGGSEGSGSDRPTHATPYPGPTPPTSTGHAVVAYDEASESDLAGRLESFDERNADLSRRLEMIRIWGQRRELDAGYQPGPTLSQEADPEHADLAQRGPNPGDNVPIDLRERIRPYTTGTIDLTGDGESTTRPLHPAR